MEKNNQKTEPVTNFEMCPVCNTKCEKSAKTCDRCGFADRLGIAPAWLDREDAEEWLEEVVLPYRRYWELRKATDNALSTGLKQAVEQITARMDKSDKAVLAKFRQMDSFAEKLEQMEKSANSVSTKLEQAEKSASAKFEQLGKSFSQLETRVGSLSDSVRTLQNTGGGAHSSAAAKS